MSRDEHRKRIPTSEELERKGAVAPLGTSAHEGRRGLFGFLRVGRIRVSGDVAARKYVPGQPHPAHPLVATEPSDSQVDSPAGTFPAGSVKDSGTTTEDADSGVRGEPSAETLPEPAALTPRRIRIDASVRERRGLGGPNQLP